MCNETCPDENKFCPICDRQTVPMAEVKELKRYECSTCSGTGVDSSTFYDCSECNGKGYWTEKEFTDQLAKEE